MKLANNIITNILGKPRVRGGCRDRDGDGVPNKKDCQPRNTMRQDARKCRNCGHDHMSYVGDEDGYNPKMRRIGPCEKCDCEFYK